MKQIKLFLSLVLIGVMTVSCDKEEDPNPERRLTGDWSLAKISAKYEGSEVEEVLQDSQCTMQSMLSFSQPQKKRGNDPEGAIRYISTWKYFELDGSECIEVFSESSRETVILEDEQVLIMSHTSGYFNDLGAFTAQVEFGVEGIFEIMLLTQLVNPEEKRIFKFARTRR